MAREFLVGENKAALTAFAGILEEVIPETWESLLGAWGNKDMFHEQLEDTYSYVQYEDGVEGFVLVVEVDGKEVFLLEEEYGYKIYVKIDEGLAEKHPLEIRNLEGIDLGIYS